MTRDDSPGMTSSPIQILNRDPARSTPDVMANRLAKLSNVMTHVGVHKAKTDLSKLLKRVAMGEEIIITSNGEPVAKLVGVSTGKKRTLGMDEGLFTVPEDFNDSLPDDLLAGFES